MEDFLILMTPLEKKNGFMCQLRLGVMTGDEKKICAAILMDVTEL